MGAYIDNAYVREDEVADEAVYWVHIPARKSLSDAKKVVRALKARAIDSFVIPDEGVLRNGISLGVFRDEQSAARLRDKLGQIGYPIKVHHSERFKTVQSVSGRLKGEFNPQSSAELMDLARAVDGNAVVELVPCGGVASPG